MDGEAQQLYGDDCAEVGLMQSAVMGKGVLMFHKLNLIKINKINKNSTANRIEYELIVKY